jgi:hypothetical protein
VGQGAAPMAAAPTVLAPPDACRVAAGTDAEDPRRPSLDLQTLAGHL